MDTLQIYTQMKRDIALVRKQASNISTRIGAGTVTASHMAHGIRYGAFERWQAQLQIMWDLSDPAEDIANNDYGLPAEEAAAWKLDGASLAALAASSERNRSKLIGFFRADHEDVGFVVPAKLLALRNAMDAARAHVAANYDVVGGVDQNQLVDPTTGKQTWKVFSGGEWAPLAPLLDTVTAACDALLA